MPRGDSTGGIGITDEYIVSYCLRRAMVNEQLYGNTTDHVDGFAIENTDVSNQLSGAKT